MVVVVSPDAAATPPPCCCCWCSDTLIKFDEFEAIAAAGKIVLPDTVFKMLAIVSVLLILSPFEPMIVSNVIVDMLLDETFAEGVEAWCPEDAPLAETVVALDTLIDDMMERTCCDTFIAFKVSSFGCDRGESCGMDDTIRWPVGVPCRSPPCRMGLREFSLDFDITCTGIVLATVVVVVAVVVGAFCLLFPAVASGCC